MVESLEVFRDLVKHYCDGSVVTPEPNDYNRVEYKDVVFNEEMGLWVRIYLPPGTSSKAPVILYYHGGGFVLFTPATPLIHNACQMWAAKLGAVIISVHYRLAPEHRLPAAYDDSIAALRWLHSQSVAAERADPWLSSNADFSRVFLAGDSAGGNIAHHVGVWAAANMREIEIKGLILFYPYFGCEERTPSEKDKSPVFTLEMADAMWSLSLPVGSDRDHPFCNPFTERPGTDTALQLPPLLFVIAGHDILRDQQFLYCDLLKKCGKEVRVHVCDEEDHAFLLLKLEEAASIETIRVISEFIN